MIKKPVEHKILKVLVQRGTFMSTREISNKAGISWNTAFKYLNNFFNKKWLTKRKAGNRVYWKAIVEGNNG